MKIIATSVVIFIAWLILGAKVTVADRPTPQRACIFMGLETTSVLARYTNSAGVFEYMKQTGLRVAWVERSQNAPEVNVGAGAADTIAYLLEQGMVQRGEGMSLMFTR